MRISDWSSDVCSSDLALAAAVKGTNLLQPQAVDQISCPYILVMIDFDLLEPGGAGDPRSYLEELWGDMEAELRSIFQYCYGFEKVRDAAGFAAYMAGRSEEHTSELQSLMRISYAVFCLKTKTA